MKRIGLLFGLLLLSFPVTSVPAAAQTPVPDPITYTECQNAREANTVNGWERDAFNWCRYGSYIQPVDDGSLNEMATRIEFKLAVVAQGSRTTRTVIVRMYLEITNTLDPSGNYNLDGGKIKVDLACDSTLATAPCNITTAMASDERFVAEWKAALGAGRNAWPEDSNSTLTPDTTTAWSKAFILDTNAVTVATPNGTTAPEYKSYGIFHPVLTFTNNLVVREPTVTVDMGGGSPHIPGTDTVSVQDPNAVINGGARFDTASYLLSQRGGARLGHRVVLPAVNGNPPVITVDFVPPVAVFSAAPGAPFEKPARHIWFAEHLPDQTYPDVRALGITKIIPGLPGDPNRLLHRRDGSDKMNRNRAVANCNLLWGKPDPVNPGYTGPARDLDCDEYPPNSTEEGVALAGFNFSVCPLDAGQNEAAGTELGLFYLNNRMLYGDSFYIDIVPAPTPNVNNSLPCIPPTNTNLSIVVNLPGGGAFASVWDTAGGDSGPLGLPLDNAFAIPGGQEQDFQNGAIYWSQDAGTHEVHGPIYQRYITSDAQSAGGPYGRLGFPMGDVTDPLATGVSAVSYFLGTKSPRDCTFPGAIYWSTHTSAEILLGCMHADYLAQGGPLGSLGFPTSDDTPVDGIADAFYATFEGTSCGTQTGSAIYRTSTAYNVIYGCIYRTYLNYGGPTGSGLGLPKNHEYDITGTTGGRRQDFDNGYITYINGVGTVFRTGNAYPIGTYGPGSGCCFVLHDWWTDGKRSDGTAVGLIGAEKWTHSNGPAAEVSWAEWTPSLPPNTWYKVWVYIPDWNASANARYRVTSPDGYSAWFTINQENYGNPTTRQGEWVMLGTFYSADGGNNRGWIKIHLSDQGPDAMNSTKVGADAIQFEQTTGPAGCPHCS